MSCQALSRVPCRHLHPRRHRRCMAGPYTPSSSDTGIRHAPRVVTRAYAHGDWGVLRARRTFSSRYHVFVMATCAYVAPLIPPVRHAVLCPSPYTVTTPRASADYVPVRCVVCSILRGTTTLPYRDDFESAELSNCWANGPVGRDGATIEWSRVTAVNVMTDRSPNTGASAAHSGTSFIFMVARCRFTLSNPNWNRLEPSALN